MRSKYVLTLFIVLTFLKSIGQSKNANDSNSKKVVADSSFLKHISESPLELFVSIYADSIDNMKTKGVPFFLNNTQLDYQYSQIGRGADNPLPLRKMIFDKVKNCTALRRIMEDSSGLYRKKPIMEDNIHVDYLNFSVFDLAANRYSVLHCALK
ncbi:MAG TPA: hypothetical protein VFE32_21985 [Puia sp.]|jgi:hypothetical protein|nr:hypothetical protein [Puia sp.]